MIIIVVVFVVVVVGIPVVPKGCWSQTKRKKNANSDNIFVCVDIVKTNDDFSGFVWFGFFCRPTKPNEP